VTRIVAGAARGRRLRTPEGTTTRPTSEKVRAAIFNLLGQHFEGGSALDLYAGSGALGFEALSRGCARAVFVESDRRAVEALRANAAHLGWTDRADVRHGRVQDLVARLPGGFTLAFVDPPYADGPAEALALLGPLLASGGRCVAEHDAKAPPPERVGPLGLVDRRRYGGTGLSIYLRD
jgi:16S rRNA (guanine(966)-N(2))-methyltransferase RsmD